MKKFFYLLILIIPAGLMAQKNTSILQSSTSKKKPSWLLTGNSGTNPAVNFLGTTDAQPLVFRVNNLTSGYLDFDSSLANTAFGYRALQLNTGIYNTAQGYRSFA